MRLYGLRYTPSPIWAEALNAKTFLWPQDIGPQEIPEGPYRFRASMINGDKRSAVPGSLYGLRRAVIKASQEQDLPLALFGPGWGASTVAHMMLGAKASLRATIAGTIPSVGEALSLANQRPQSWLGTVDDKQVAFASAPIAIVIENSADYVSEKLIDSIRGGAAPVYVGPPLARFELPESMVLTADPVATSVINAVRSMSVARIDEIRSAGGSWLMSTNAKKHAICEVLTSLGSTIGEQLNRT